MKCRDCKFFQRPKFAKVLGAEDQFGGKCSRLWKELVPENSILWSVEDEFIYVQASFGCSLFEKREEK